jgi:aldehyde dehydrogenase (NAD+)
MEKDLGRSRVLTELGESEATKGAALWSLNNMDRMMADVVTPTELGLAPATTKIRYEPLGVVGVMGAWNFPFGVTLRPMVDAISAGNCVLIKPSELAPNASAVMKMLVEKYLDNEAIIVVEGAADVARAVTELPLDMMCFTGSTQTGKLVA